MWKMIKFPFKLVAFILSPFTGYNPFKRDKKGDLPNKIYKVRFCLVLGFGDEKALCKGIEKAFGLDMRDILREVNGIDISMEFCGGDEDMWGCMSTPQGVISWCQAEPEALSDEFGWAEPRTPTVCVDGEILARLEASKAVAIYSRTDITERVYKFYRNLSRKSHLIEATRLMIKDDECSDDCDECDTNFHAEGLSLEGDCPNCGRYQLPEEDLEKYIDQAEKNAA